MVNPPFRAPGVPGALFALICLLTLPLACEDTPEVSDGGETCENSEDCAVGQFCNEDSECESECASCGQSCERTENCPVGQFCDTTNNTCQQECVPGDDVSCGTRRKCSDDGMCVADDDFEFNGGGAGGIGGDGDQECIDVEVDFTPEIPNVVLLIDHSGSMDSRDGFGQNVDDAIDGGDYEAWDCGDDYGWRWNVARNVLLHPENGVVKPLEENVRFGYVSYTSNAGFSGGTCPLLESVDLGFSTHADMLAEFECSEPVENQDTPTRESLTQVAEVLAGLDLDGPKVIVLVTDGSPDTCTCNNWNSASGDTCADTEENQVERGGQMLSPAQAEQYDVIVEAERIHDELGVTIEVINMSSESQTELANHLDQVAERGGAVSGASIPGFSPSALTEAFSSIIDGVRSCVIDLDGSITEGKESTGTVRLDMDPSEEVDFERIELDDPDGWVVLSPTQIELVGEACETVKSGDHELDISFPCDSFVAR